MALDLGRIEFSPLKDAVYEKIVGCITSGKLSPGTPITISQLSEQFGVSLMPVREALRKLEAGNLISIQKNRRIIIKELTKADLNELLKIRLNLECMAAREALKNVNSLMISKLERILEEMKSAKNLEEYFEKNKQFHFTIYKNAKMPILQEIIDNLWRRVSPYIHIYVSTSPVYKSSKLRYHKEILKAIKVKDSKMICKWLKLDLNRAAKLVSSLLKDSRS
jgi:DNA-binding GntR family transcriptional regulator